MKTGLGFAGVITIIIGLILSPVITFWCGYFGGWILQCFVGERVVAGLNLMFDTTRFTLEVIPLTCAMLAVIGSYFKARQTNNNNK